MALLACGINYQTAPLKLREKLVFSPEGVGPSLIHLVKTTAVQEAAILSTCHRTELYCTTNAVEEVVQWLHDRHPLPNTNLSPYLYTYTDESTVRHLLRVACGLDSMVLGEPEILGQVKTAFSLAKEAGTVGKYFHRLFPHVFSVTKQVRSDTAVGEHPLSIAQAAVSLAKRVFEKLSNVTVLLIGAGETIESAATCLSEHKVARMLMTNRTLLRAERLARKVNATAFPIELLSSHLAEADIIITATTSALPLLGKGAVETALKVRKRKPMLMIDLAVPRDIEPEVAALSDVYLFNVDDLRAVVENNFKSRQAAAQEAEKIIDFQAAHFMRSLRSLEGVPAVCAYRDKMEMLRNETLGWACAQLEKGRDPAEVLAEFGRLLTNKIMHLPSEKMRQAAYEGQSEILEVAQYLFDLK